MMAFAEIVGTASSFFTWSTVLLFGLFFVLVYVLLDAGRPKDFPPGPPILPLIGSLPFTGPPSSKNFFKLREKYGKVFGFGLLNRKAVVLSDTEAIKEAMHQTASTGRPQIIFLLLRNRILTQRDDVDNIGILGTWGPNWQEQRRFVLKNLRDLGFGKTSLEPLMHEEVLELMEYIEEQEGKPIPMQTLFNRSVLNMLWAMVMGKRFSYSDPGLKDIISRMDTLVRSLNPVAPVAMIPGLRKFVRLLPSIRRVEGIMSNIFGFLLGELRVLHQAYEEGDRTDHLVGVYLDAIEKSEESKTSLHLNNLKAVIMELFIAGSETTSSTLTMAIFLMTEHPEVQTRVQEELEAVVGLGNVPSFEHMEKLPYTLAALHEVQRFISLVPLSVPHAALQDFTVKGFRIPKGTFIFPHLESSNKNPKYWKFPDTFNPGNFLDELGNFVKNDAFMPFGNGRRQCVGEPLARLELFLIFACLAHKFTFSLASVEYKASSNNLINRPPLCSVYAKKRF